MMMEYIYSILVGRMKRVDLYCCADSTGFVLYFKYHQFWMCKSTQMKLTQGILNVVILEYICEVADNKA